MIKSISSLGFIVASVLVSYGLADTKLEAASSDAHILAEIHSINQLEIDAGKLAAKVAVTPGVKSYGRHLVSDHSQADKKVKSLAHAINVDLKKTQESDSQLQTAAADNNKLLDDLKASTGKDFQDKFLSAMEKGHKDAIGDVKSALEATQNPKVKAFLEDLLPDLEKHEELAKNLSAATGA